MPGQEAFGTIQEVVQILEADPTTDWSKVNIAALREHLIDVNEVTLRAVATEQALENGFEIAVTGEGRTLQAIRRMVPAHVGELVKIGWDAKTEDLPNGVKLSVTTNDPKQVNARHESSEARNVCSSPISGHQTPRLACASVARELEGNLHFAAKPAGCE